MPTSWRREQSTRLDRTRVVDLSISHQTAPGLGVELQEIRKHSSQWNQPRMREKCSSLYHDNTTTQMGTAKIRSKL